MDKIILLQECIARVLCDIPMDQLGSFTLTGHVRCGYTLVMHSGPYAGVVFRPQQDHRLPWKGFNTGAAK